MAANHIAQVNWIKQLPFNVFFFAVIIIIISHIHSRSLLCVCVFCSFMVFYELYRKFETLTTSSNYKWCTYPPDYIDFPQITGLSFLKRYPTIYEI